MSGRAEKLLRGAGLVLLCSLCSVYATVSIGIFSLGLVTFPCVLLGRYGVLTVVSDLAPETLLAGSAGVLLLGAGMCLCVIPVCAGVYTRITRFLRMGRHRTADETGEAGEANDANEANEAGEVNEENTVS